MTRARELSRLANANALTVDTNLNVGIGSTTLDAKLDVVGIVSATAFYGDGSNLDGITSAGLGTAVEAGSLYGGEQIYYTNTVLSIGGTVTVNPPATSSVAYTQYVEVAVDQDADLILEDGDELVLDILGIGTDGLTVLPGNGGVGMQLPATFRDPVSTVGAPGPVSSPFSGADTSGKYWVAGGGGGAPYNNGGTSTPGTGGAGGGGAGGDSSTYTGNPGAQNTGGGGGGARTQPNDATTWGGTGGSGIVIIAYPS